MYSKYNCLKTRFNDELIKGFTGLFMSMAILAFQTHPAEADNTMNAASLPAISLPQKDNTHPLVQDKNNDATPNSTPRETLPASQNEIYLQQLEAEAEKGNLVAKTKLRLIKKRKEAAALPADENQHNWVD